MGSHSVFVAQAAAEHAVLDSWRMDQKRKSEQDLEIRRLLQEIINAVNEIAKKL